MATSYFMSIIFVQFQYTYSKGENKKNTFLNNKIGTENLQKVQWEGKFSILLKR